MLLYELEFVELFVLLLPQLFDIVHCLGVFLGFEYLVKSLFERRRLTHGPQTLILMTKNHGIQYSFGDTKILWENLIEFRHSS